MNPITHTLAVTGLAPSALARLLGVTPGAVQHWRRGARAIPGPVQRLCYMLTECPQTSAYYALREAAGV